MSNEKLNCIFDIFVHNKMLFRNADFMWQFDCIRDLINSKTDIGYSMYVT